MVNALSVSTDRLPKVVLVGSAGAGKSGIVKAVAEKYAHSSVRVALHSMALNAQQNCLDLTELPAAVHYHRASIPAFEPYEMDAWLGIAPGAVPRLITGPEDHSQLPSSVERIIVQIVNRSDRAAERPTHSGVSKLASDP